MSARLSDAYLGEDVPVAIQYNDPDTGDAVDPDDTDADGVPDASVTITDDGGTEHVTAAAMSHLSTGEFEYVWDTSVDAGDEGTYEVEVSAEFSGDTKIERVQLPLR